jgi:tetratricopeptide (TPR) repeat protein
MSMECAGPQQKASGRRRDCQSGADPGVSPVKRSRAMTQPVSPARDEVFDPTAAREAIERHRQRNEWEPIAALGRHLPAELTVEWLWLADEVAFALSRLQRTEPAAALLERAFALEPTARRASSLAYVYYDILLATRRPPRRGEHRPPRDRERDRQAFTHWMQRALELAPDDIKNLYRLGVFEAQVQSRRDVAALRAFERAIAVYRALPPARRAARPDLHKPYVRSLYAAGRSALRLGRLADARRHSFACIREDERTDHVAPLHKLFLAGKVCLEQGQYDHAERAFRLALDGKGPPGRDFVYPALAEVARRAGRLDDAVTWIDRYLEPHRRSAAAWRLLGDIRLAQGKTAEARVAWENALRRDRGGRHLTLTRLGELARASGDAREARRCYEQAAAFRRRQYLSEHLPALRGLLALAEAEPDAARVAELQRLIAGAAPDARHGAPPPEEEDDEGQWSAA